MTRSVPTFVSPARDTHLIAQMLVDGRNIGTGLVADPALTTEQRDLWIEARRPGHYMESFLRPASDAAERAATAEPSLERVRHQLNSWRGTLGAELHTHSDFTFSPPAAGRRRRTA
jgi:hypothetical protein